MSKLKSCPFCGSSEVDTMEIKMQVGDNEPTYSDGAECFICSATGLSHESWNTRHNGWISVDDKLPEMIENVLVSITNDMVDGSVSEAIHEMGGVFVLPQELSVNKMNARPCVGVTHWMPLPSAP